ncbi:hypothetical protein BST61_g9877 [Cercospora zeina]
MSEPQATPAQVDASKRCATCSGTPESLKHCAKCKKVLYCNRECQKAHWKTHKKDCARLAGGSGQSFASASRSDSKPFTAISQGNFLHDRSEDETYKILVDIVRMRQEDTYTFEGDTMVGTIYNQERSSEPAFRDMIRRAKRVDGLLPPWWTDEKEEECIRKNRVALTAAQEKSDIQEAWGDDVMPMKLRMLGERIWGNTPGVSGTQGGETMLQVRMAMENGDMMGSTLDVNRMFSRP